MTRVQRIAAITISLTSFLCSAASAFADEPAAKPVGKSVAPSPKATAAKAAKPKPQLSPEAAAIRDQLRQVLAVAQKQPFNTRQNSPTEVASVCLAFGCDAEVSLEGADGRRINGITCLCWNYPCDGFELLRYRQKHIAARVGYGYQQHPGEFLATLAMARVPADYPVRVGKDARKIADLVEGEKLACRSGGDASLRLIGLCYYVAEPEWKNDLGETWSIGRMLKEEVAQPIVTAPEGGLNRLMAISYVLAHRAKLGSAFTEQIAGAEKYIREFQDFALRCQNSDGSWGSRFFAERSQGTDAAAQLRSTGRILEWLAMSLPEEKLKDPRVLAAVDYLSRLAGSQRYQDSAPSLSTQEITSLGHALHALAVYDQRALKPFDAADSQTPATANRDGEPANAR
jgi:hypothetical protein